MSRIVSIPVPRAGRRYLYKARLPATIKSQSSPALRKAIDDNTQHLTTKPGCLIVFFRKPRGGYKAIQRCEGRSIKPGSAFARKAAARLKGPNKAVCRKGKAAPKKKQGQFAPCKRGRSRR